jgi:tetratricopeptide (TPR) repeat protein
MKHHWKICLIIFLLGLFIRSIYFVESRKFPHFYFPIVDSLTYHQGADTYLKKGEVHPDFIWHGLFYPFFITLGYAVSGSSIYFVKLVQLIVGALIPVLVYLFSVRLFANRTAALISAFLTCIYMPLVFFEQELLATGWAVFFSLLFLYLICQLQTSPTYSKLFFFGSVTALLILTRPVFIAVCLFMVIWLLVNFKHLDFPVFSMKKGVSFLVAGFSLIALPAALINNQVTNSFSILPSSGGINLFIGNNPNYQRTITARPGLAWQHLTALPENFTGYAPADKEQVYYQLVADYLISQPGDFLMGLLNKALQFFNSREIPRNLDIYLFRRWSSLLTTGLGHWGSFGFPFGLILPLALIGIIRLRKKIPIYIWIFLIVYPLSIIFFFTAARYRLPYLPILFIFSGAGGQLFFLSLKNFKKLLSNCLICFAAALPITLPGPFLAEKMDLEAEYYFNVAESGKTQNDFETIAQLFKQALYLKPNYIEAHYKLALMYLQHQQPLSAISHLQTVLKIDFADYFSIPANDIISKKKPANQEIIKLYFPELFKNTHHLLAMAFRDTKQWAKAIAHYLSALKIVAEHPLLLEELAYAYLENSQQDKALPVFKKVIEKIPGHWKIYYEIGKIYFGHDKTVALPWFYEAVRINPSHADSHYFLGLCYLAENKISQADEEFRLARQLDENNPLYSEKLPSIPGQGIDHKK